MEPPAGSGRVLVRPRDGFDLHPQVLGHLGQLRPEGGLVVAGRHQQAEDQATADDDLFDVEDLDVGAPRAPNRAEVTPGRRAP